MLDFTRYQIKFNKTYATLEEDRKKMKIFFNNTNEITKQNKIFKKDNVSLELGMNQFGDWVSFTCSTVFFVWRGYYY